MANPFYCDNTTKYREEFPDLPLTSIKAINNTIFLTLYKLMNNRGSVECLSKKLYSALIKETAFSANINGCKEKMHFLIEALKNPDNRDIFECSPLKAFLLMPYAEGYTRVEDKDKNWLNYKPGENCEVRLATLEPFVAATVCERENRKTNIGLDFTVVLDCLIKKDPKTGKFYLTDEMSAETKSQLLDATERQLQVLRANPRFNENFNYIAPENESEDE